jgi:hypothetical protein
MEERSKTVEIIRRIGAPEPEKISITGILKSHDLSFLLLTLPAADDPPAAVLRLLGSHGVNIRFITLYDASPETAHPLRRDGSPERLVGAPPISPGPS